MINTYYQKHLPKALISFSSEEGKKIFKSSLEEGNMECFFHLIEQFHTQNEPACKF
jgi:glutathione gamma-glutamylcysteinyltransferase